MLATLASLVSMADHDPCETAPGGVDYSSAWLDDHWSTRPPMLFECGGAKHRIGGWAVIDDRWKLIIDVDGDGRERPGRLYDLMADPGETHDRARDGEKEKAVLDRLERILRAELAGAGWTSLADPG
jgi:hypothetical protein